MAQTITVDGVEVTVPAEKLGTDPQRSGRMTAFKDGASAASLGNPRSSNPYAAQRGSGSFRVAWFLGWDAFAAARMDHEAASA
jgi:hypothetical protein